MTNEDFSYIALRVLDHISLADDLKVKVIGFGGIQIALGLVRTGDYESVVSALSLLTALATGEQIADLVRCNGIRALVRLLQQHQPEYR
jgi:ABC-type sugar transport system substrate-binding protein